MTSLNSSTPKELFFTSAKPEMIVNPVTGDRLTILATSAENQ